MGSLSARSEYSDILPLNAKFVLENVHPTWAEIAWGYEMGLIGWHALKEFAQAALRSAPESGATLLTLAHLTKENASTAGELVRSLAQGSDPDEVAARKKWAYLLLKELYGKRSHVADPFGVVEHIYADFDYPEELEGFVRWMPASEPVATPEEGAAKMEQRWQRYLSDGADRFGRHVSSP